MSKGALDDAGGYRRDDPQARWNRPRRPKAKKDTRRWCKGVEGREHQPAITRDRSFWRKPCYRPDPDHYSWALGCYHEESCTVCGKVLRWRVGYEECPELNP